jgi:1-acyl-sn-glycerol-3-phosphate acyltransferase
MPYKHGRPIIDFSFFFRFASILVYSLLFPIAFLMNFIHLNTRYKYRFRLNGFRKAITVSNHTTLLDPAKIAGLVSPWIPIYQTMLESTVEVPVFGTFTRTLGGVPIPRGIYG